MRAAEYSSSDLTFERSASFKLSKKCPRENVKHLIIQLNSHVFDISRDSQPTWKFDA